MGYASVSKYINGYQRQKPTQGTRFENNIIINQLPRIGSTIVVEEIVISSRNKKYQLSTARLDVWNRPILYEVIGYTEGIENPLSSNNKMQCQYYIGNEKAKPLKSDIPTIHIATGSMRCVEASPERMKEWGYC